MARPATMAIPARAATPAKSALVSAAIPSHAIHRMPAILLGPAIRPTASVTIRPPLLVPPAATAAPAMSPVHASPTPIPVAERFAIHRPRFAMNLSGPVRMASAATPSLASAPPVGSVTGATTTALVSRWTMRPARNSRWIAQPRPRALSVLDSAELAFATTFRPTQGSRVATVWSATA